MDPVWQRVDELLQKRAGDLNGGAFFQAHEGELGSPIDGHEQVELAFGCAHLGNVNVEVADRIALEPFVARFVAFGLRQPTDAVALQTPVQ